MMTAAERALFSSDGKQWHGEKKKLTWSKQPQPDVTKLVIGVPPTSGAEANEIKLELPANFARIFPNLTHLHLWQISNLTTLPELPHGLLCLDLRGCRSLAALPELPPSLETLDLGVCISLARLPSSERLAESARLTRFYFNDCSRLKSHHISTFLEPLVRGPMLELDGSQSALTSLDEVPRPYLRKLVLRGCSSLTDITGLSHLTRLEHLNLSHCTAIKSLPTLPRLRFLALHGAEQLNQFLGQDIGPYDRGGEGENVIARFQSRSKFGGQLAIMPHAKLLLLGDGRVGKSTLAKRLQWESLSPTERQLPKNQQLKPHPKEPFTHKVQFWSWQTGLTLPEQDLTSLEQRATTAKVSLPRTAQGDLDGAIRLWDFGGQEIYHHTHRIFAGEGSIFLIVWRADPQDIGDPPADVPAEEWIEWNRHRTLDYWLDYIESMRRDAKVALVCTNCPDPDRMPSKPDWKTRAPKHAHRDLPSFFVDSLDTACGSHQEYRRLVTWIRAECGREAHRIGILQPSFYRQVSDLLGNWLSDNSAARREERIPQHLLCPWENWRQSLRSAFVPDPSHPDLSLEDSDIETITDYLHQAGHLFQIRHDQHRAVLVDQGWAADLIYRLLLCSGSLRAKVKRNGGWFYQSELESDAEWEKLNLMQRSRLLSYMEECAVVTRIADADRQRISQNVFLATDTWLMPAYDKVQDDVDRQMSRLRADPDMKVQEKFEFDAFTMNEFDFRGLQARLARTFGTGAIYFRNGFQAIDSSETPEWCFRVRWTPANDDPFRGTIGAVLVAKSRSMKSLNEQVDDLFFSEGSPLAPHGPALHRRSAEDRDLHHDYFVRFRPAEYDVAVSSSGADREEAQALVAALQGAGFKVNYYLLHECRKDDRLAVMNFMRSLSLQPCIVLLISDGYLRNDPDANWYCAWELADAITQLHAGKRSSSQTIAVYKPSPTVSSSNLDKLVVAQMDVMTDHFWTAYSNLSRHVAPEFAHYHKLYEDFKAAVEGGKCQKFYDLRGTPGSYLKLPGDINSPEAFEEIVEAVRKGLGN